MKSIFAVASFLVLTSSAFAQQKEKTTTELDPTKKIYIADAACGQCQFHMKGKGCSLAVHIDGKTYFVDGTDIDSHGDAHADDGFCNKVRKAKVQGEVVNGRFEVSYFALLPEKKKPD